MKRDNLSMSLMVVAAMLAWCPPPRPRATDIAKSFTPRPRRYPSGPCEVCGKPDVRAGRERGIYRCQKHMEDAR